MLFPFDVLAVATVATSATDWVTTIASGDDVLGSARTSRVGETGHILIESVEFATERVDVREYLVSAVWRHLVGIRAERVEFASGFGPFAMSLRVRLTGLIERETPRLLVLRPLPEVAVDLRPQASTITRT